MATPSPSHHRMSDSPFPDPESAASLAVTVAKKPQPIPWTHEETVNLIRAYQEKWYSLNRGPLKASQWEEVAVTISLRCRASNKTGTQCRHKIEKLRKRYRTEKTRPNPAVAWPYFNLMEQMERGPLPISVALPDDEDDDYVHEPAKRRKVEPRVSRGLDELNDMVDGFLKKGNMYGEQRLRSCSNPVSTNSRFQKRKFPAREEYQEYEEEAEDEEEIGVRKKGNDRDMMGELAAQMKEFSERFMRMERKKMEAMRETQRYRMEMENKRMQMIFVAQQKTIDMISRAFADNEASSSSPSSSSPSDKKFQMS